MRKLSLVAGLYFGLATVFFLSGCGQPAGPIPPSSWDHVVVVWEENRDAGEVSGLPYIAQLRAMGRTYSRSYGVARPSQPNYIAVFAGSTMGVADNLSHDLSGPNLYSRFADAGLAMMSYAQGLPSDGFVGEASGRYVRKHNPAASFLAASVRPVPAAAVTSFARFPSDYATLPQLSFVIPDLDNDMHDGTPAQADAWLNANLGAYAVWARTHNSLLILTFDEPNGVHGADLSNPILTVFVGAGIAPGTSDFRRIDHYRVSDYLLDCFGLPRLTLR
jgi:phosphatidylinositol-3-phosphatase